MSIEQEPIKEKLKLINEKEINACKEYMEIKKRKEKKVFATKEEELFYYLDTTPSQLVLKDVANGREPAYVDVQLVNDLKMRFKMPLGVLNVFINYVLLRTNMKLPKNYMEKIASHWMRKDFKTAREATDFAREEHEKYIKWKNKQTKKI